jgi:two-component system cell cycle response regulator|uniref:diguanylate cyclase n=1 Tax=Desulfobacca acetoxidans TaxID=60893 RepID=A0A7V6A5C0_9BACT
MTKDIPCEAEWSILVVEDHPAARQLMELRLRKAGYRVMAAGDGREALETLKHHFCPLVITDWMMPGMDGLAFCRAVRRKSWEGYVYIILITAKDSQEDIIRGLEAGADDYLTKPVHPAELLARLKTGHRILKLERTLKECNQEIARLSITDPLTGIYNRRYLNDTLPVEIKRALRYKRPLGLLLCDLDHFKRINDAYGHNVGDLVLKEFAGRLKGSVRDGIDWLARYGGEEFVLVLPETDLAGSFDLAERLRRLVAEKVIATPAGGINITASFGISCFSHGAQENPRTPETLLDEADQCMYQAKKAGRNRVVGPTGTP